MSILQLKFCCFVSAALIYMDTEYQDPEMFLPDRPAARPPIQSASVRNPQASVMKPPLRQTVSTIDDRNYVNNPVGKEVCLHVNHTL